MESIILLLITICIIVLVVGLVFWVLQQVGVSLPPQTVRIVWVIVALVVLLYILRALPALSIHRLF